MAPAVTRSLVTLHPGFEQQRWGIPIGDPQKPQPAHERLTLEPAGGSSDPTVLGTVSCS